MAKAVIRKPMKKKACAFCKEGAAPVDYKDVPLLRKYISDRGKIRARVEIVLQPGEGEFHERPPVTVGNSHGLKP